MAVEKGAQNLIKSTIGAVTKAVLCIRNANRVGSLDPENPDKEAINQGIADAVEIEKDLMEKANEALKGGVVSEYSDIKGMVEDNGYIAIEVEYNPSSLRLDTTAGRQMKYSGDGGNTQLQQYDAPPSTTLSFELLFDDVNNMDAFMLGDNPITNFSASNTINAVSSAVKGKYSVQDQIDGLLALLTIEPARHVIFFWGAMCFRGQVTSVSASYTMFNKKGYPVRGKVSMQIRQGEDHEALTESDKLPKYNYNEKYWMDAFDATFREKSLGEKIQGGAEKALNNSLLNLKL